MLFRTDGLSSANNHSEATMNAASSAGHSLTGHRSEHSSMREHYDKLANDRAHTLAEASLLKA